MRRSLLTSVQISIIQVDEGGLLWSDPEIGVDWPIEGRHGALTSLDKDKAERFSMHTFKF